MKQDQHLTDLASWVVQRVERAKSETNTLYHHEWDRYYRLWRGIWSGQDRDRQSERSRIIVPALAEAIEATAAEIQSAFLSKGDAFFDMVDTGSPDDRAQLDVLKKQLREDMGRAKFDKALVVIFMMGTLFGTGIGRLMVTEKKVRSFERSIDGNARAVEKTIPTVKLIPVLPHNFVIETAATDMDDSSFVAEYVDALPHVVRSLMEDGTYNEVPIHLNTPRRNPSITGEKVKHNAEIVQLIEYQGLVPESLLSAPVLPEGGVVVDLFEGDSSTSTASREGEDSPVSDHLDEPWVPALVTVMDKGTVLRAVPNPTLSQENTYVAYRHEPVPNQFWGRGVGEKGLHPQLALDASMRARLDGMALSVHPMMGVDTTKLPRNFKFKVSPGNTIRTQGRPSESLEQINFGKMDPSQYTDISELKNQVSMATGALDTGIQLEMQAGNGTFGGLSMVMSGFIKRSLRTINMIESELMEPLVRKTFELYMLIDPERYPPANYTFKGVSSAGQMARELEQAQYANLLKTIPADSPAYWMILKAIYENSSVADREMLLQQIEGQLEKALNPPPPQPDPLVELKRVEVEGRIRSEQARQQVEFIRAQAEIVRAANEARLAPSEEARNEAAAILDLAKAEAQEIGHQLNTYKAQLESLQTTTSPEAASAGVTADAAIRQVLSGGVTASGQPTGQPGVPDPLAGL